MIDTAGRACSPPFNLLSPLDRGIAMPMSIDREPFGGEDLPALDVLMCKALSGTYRSEIERALDLLRYVCGELRPGMTCGFTTASAVFSAKEVTCAGFVKALVGLARAAGIPAREASFNGLANCIGHTVCELWAGGCWICMDAKFGLLFSASETWDADALLDFRGLTNGDRGHYLFKVLGAPWCGKDNLPSGTLPCPVETGYAKDLVDDLEAYYRDMVRTAYPVTYRSAATCFHLQADLRNEGLVRLDRMEAPMPLPGTRYLGFGPGNGSISLGFAYMNLMQLRTLAPRTVTAEIIFQTKAPDLMCLPLANVRVLEKRCRSSRKVLLTLRTTAEEAMVLLHAADYAALKQISLCVKD